MKKLFVSLALVFLTSCAGNPHRIIVSAADQRMVLLREEKPVAFYPVSTSKFGLGDRPGTNWTPLGRLQIAEKIGGGAPLGMKFKNRRATGEIVPVNAPGRDPIVTRILWLRGTSAQNRHTYSRYIYIHGTPEEYKIGFPASFGCIRMRSRDIVHLYSAVSKGTVVDVVPDPLIWHLPRQQ